MSKSDEKCFHSELDVAQEKLRTLRAEIECWEKRVEELEKELSLK